VNSAPAAADRTHYPIIADPILSIRIRHRLRQVPPRTNPIDYQTDGGTTADINLFNPAAPQLNETAGAFPASMSAAPSSKALALSRLCGGLLSSRALRSRLNSPTGASADRA